jgi:hypothetical protein
MKRAHWSKTLDDLGACQEGLEWSRGQESPKAAWEACERADWMLWYIGATIGGDPESAERKKLVLCACECARTALKHVPAGECRPRIAIKTAERWARGEPSVSQNDVRNAANAACAASSAASWAAYCAASAAYWAASDAASLEAYNAARNEAHLQMCGKEAHLQMCAVIRRYFPFEETLSHR